MASDLEEGMISLLPDVPQRSFDELLADIFDQHKMPRLGGASGKGWSSYSMFQRCPYLYKVSYVDGERAPAGPALEIGSALHTFMALHYTWMVKEDLTLTPEVCKDALLDAGGRAESILAAWRYYDSYRAHYEIDYLYPLAVEELAIGENGNSCRFDLIARVDKPQPGGILPGVYNVDHKTSARMTTDYLDGWQNDGEIIGQMMIWKQAKLDKKYGKLRGSIVNIIGKQKTPQFARVVVPFQPWHVKQHNEDLQLWAMQQNICRATGTWPRARNNCTTKFGTCHLFQHCSTNQKETPRKRLEQLLKKAHKHADDDSTQQALASDAAPSDTENTPSLDGDNNKKD